MLHRDSPKIEGAARDIFTQKTLSERQRASGNRTEVYKLSHDVEGAAVALLSILKSEPNDPSYDADFADVRHALDGIRASAELPDIASLNGEFHPASVLDVTSRHADALESASHRLHQAVRATLGRVGNVRDMDGKIVKLNESIRRLNETAAGLAPRDSVYLPTNLVQKRAKQLVETRVTLSEKEAKLSRKQGDRNAMAANRIGGVEVMDEGPPQPVLDVLNEVRRQLEDVNIVDLSPRDAKEKYASVYEAAKQRISSMAKLEQQERSVRMSQQHREHMESFGPKADMVLAYFDRTMAGRREAYVAMLDVLYAKSRAYAAENGSSMSSVMFNDMITAGYADIEQQKLSMIGILLKQSEELLEMLPDSLEDMLILIDMTQQKVQKRSVILAERKKKGETKMLKTGDTYDLPEISADIRHNDHLYTDLEQLKSIGHFTHPIQSLRIAGASAVQRLMSFVGRGTGQTA